VAAVAPAEPGRDQAALAKTGEDSCTEMRIAVDTGGTFTDLVIEDGDGLQIHKAPTTPDDPVRGVLDAVEVAARAADTTVDALLGQADLFIHGTTRATNAILTHTTARTAFLTTKGHPDVLVFREGGRNEPFNYTQAYPEPYIPRALTYQVPERVGADGAVLQELDEPATLGIIDRLAADGVDAVAVCLLWSFMNPVHEERIGQLLGEHLPTVPFTLSHRLNPIIREYRRASSTALDASLKPLMTDYLDSLEERLRRRGFRGRVLVVTSSGGVLDAAAVARAPIHSIGSGPAMAPVAGRYYAEADGDSTTAVIADAGGTSYDVSLVRRGRIPSTAETWLGLPYLGEMTGFPSVDVKSIGAGGGSIAWVDEGGLLHIGPQSAGAVPGPACYGNGGTRPTVTDASLVLGYIDANYFLGGRMELNGRAAQTALDDEVASKLGLSLHEAAAAVLKLTTENMVGAIEDITVKQGIDPRTAVLVGGGGAAGLNAVAIARRLGMSRVIIPQVAAALSAAGALMSDLMTEFAVTRLTKSVAFDYEAVNSILDELRTRCQGFIDGPGSGALESEIELFVEAHYPDQVWELEVPLTVTTFSGPDDVERLRQDFHTAHLEAFAINDPESSIEVMSWHARVRCRLREPGLGGRAAAATAAVDGVREVFFPETGVVEAKVRLFDAMDPGTRFDGPTIIESPITTVVVDSYASVERTATGSLSILPWGKDGRAAEARASFEHELR
jgi:N-methylhydantoinase A